MQYETIKIDFGSDEAIYIQLRNQIVFGIATARIQEGESLPSVRQLADTIGINMHTVNKAYSLLREEGLVTLDRRHGAIVRVDVDKLFAMEEMKAELRVILAEAVCKNISKQEICELVEEIYQEYE
ncbi:MAG: GntR family transcriptional regulator [Lachnospiraceae bacterium]|nr:GntR family transcriptional regulator [Lachnospiraceae bacterium]